MPAINRPFGAKFSKSIDYALREHATLPLRSEKHGHYRDLYVDVDQLQELNTSDWQVIYGRRGTGKTLLLGMLVELTRAELDRGQLSIMIPAQECKVSPVGRAIPDKTRALGYFQSFLELLIDKVTGQLEHLLVQPSFLGRFTGQRRRTIDRAFELMVDLLELATQGRPVAAFSTTEQVNEQRSASTRATSAGGKLEVDIGRDIRMGAKGGLEHKRQSADENSKYTRTESQPLPRFALVSKTLQELLKLLKVDRLNILIDEWSTLDPTGATAIQPEFAELLKRTFHGVPSVSVKIATNRYQTRFSNRGAGGSYRGLELEADMFEAINLDRALLDRDGLVSFYEALLLNRLAFFDESLNTFRADNGGFPHEAFVLAIFHDRRAFEELVKGAEGIPRDFIALVKAVAKAHRHSVKDRWTARAIQDVIRQRSVSGLEDIEYRSITSQMMDPCMKAVVTKTGSRIFFVSKNDHPKVADALDELLEKRIIHDYPREELPGFARERNRAYLMDYGVWLDWERTRAGDVPPGPENGLPQDWVEVEEWQVDLDQIDHEHELTCPHCGHAFTPDEPSYALKRLCPECFEPVDEPVDSPS
ncbi:MAG TPA: hypothetical protein VHR18_01180 [Solirubrobacterales bacterium]|jgi:hypothetical protein|nr:hypothetical protein [Solirubrobacterales bacterium]